MANSYTISKNKKFFDIKQYFCEESPKNEVKEHKTGINDRYSY